MTTTLQNLFFVAIVPPQPVFDEIQEMRLHFRDRYKSEKALKSPPHITLLAPFKVKEEHENNLITLLQKSCQSFRSFHIEVKDFSAFAPRVIYVDVLKNDELEHLQESLEREARSKPEIFNYNYDERPFRPHMTLAFRDLSKQNFHKGWEEFKDKKYEAEFIAHAITLLKHDGKKWQIEEVVELRK